MPRINVINVSRAASEMVRNHKSIFGKKITLGLCRFTSTNNWTRADSGVRAESPMRVARSND